MNRRPSRGDVEYFAGEAPKLVPRIGVAGIAHRIVILTGNIVNHTHGPEVPNITGSIEVFGTSNSIPVAGGIHPLPAIVGSGQNIVRPEELFCGIVDQDGIVRHSSTVVIQVVRALRVGVVRTAIDRQVTAVINRELVLVEVLVFGEIWTAVELNPGRIRLPAVPHHQVTHASEIALARKFLFTGQSWISRVDFRIVPKKLQDRKHHWLGKNPLLRRSHAL